MSDVTGPAPSALTPHAGRRRAARDPAAPLLLGFLAQPFRSSTVQRVTMHISPVAHAPPAPAAPAAAAIKQLASTVAAAAPNAAQELQETVAQTRAEASKGDGQAIR